MLTPVFFQPEIATLEAQVAELQAQMQAASERMAHFNEAETVAAGIFQAVQNGIERFSTLAPDAIARLSACTATRNLFANPKAFLALNELRSLP